MDTSVLVSEFLEFGQPADGLFVLLKFERLGGGEHIIGVPPDILQSLIPTILSTQPQAEAASATGRKLHRKHDVHRFEVGGEVGASNVLLTLEPVTGGSITFRFDRETATQLRDVLVKGLG